jgi:hypothetical protein
MAAKSILAKSVRESKSPLLPSSICHTKRFYHSTSKLSVCSLRRLPLTVLAPLASKYILGSLLGALEGLESVEQGCFSCQEGREGKSNSMQTELELAR